MKNLPLISAASLFFLALACQAPTGPQQAVVEPEHSAITTESLEPYECGDIKRLHTMGGVFTR